MHPRGKECTPQRTRKDIFLSGATFNLGSLGVFCFVSTRTSAGGRRKKPAVRPAKQSAFPQQKNPGYAYLVC